MMPNSTLSLAELFKNHSGKLSDKWEQYFMAYEAELACYRANGLPVRLLEVGVQNGGSLELWHDFLPEGSSIVGVDIDERVSNLTFGRQSIEVHVCDATDRDSLVRVIGAQPFDIIIDDGSHICNDVNKTFITLFDYLLPKGKYFIEDLHCSYFPMYGGGFRKEISSIENLKSTIDALHVDYIGLDKILDEKDRSTLLKLNRWLARITFYDSIAVLEKLSQEKNQPYRRALTGDTQKVVSVHSLLPHDISRPAILGETLLRSVEKELIEKKIFLEDAMSKLSSLVKQLEGSQRQLEDAITEAKTKIELYDSLFPIIRGEPKADPENHGK